MSLSVPSITGGHSTNQPLQGYAIGTSGGYQNHHYVLKSSSSNVYIFETMYIHDANAGSLLSSQIQFNATTGEWSDNNSGSPAGFSNSQSGSYSSTLTATTDDFAVHLQSNNGVYYGGFTLSGYTPSTGPTITSITATKIFVPSDTVSNTDFTLLKDGSAYANTNIAIGVSASNLNGNAGPQPPSDARGYAYALTYNGTAWYSRTIDSKSFHSFYYDDSWTSSPNSGRSTNSNRILNVIGTIPTGTAITSDITLVLSDFGDRFLHYGNYDNILSSPTKQYGFYVTGNASDVVGYFYYYPTGFVGSVQYSSPFTIGAQETMSFTAGGHTVSIIDWIYDNEPEGDGYVAPVTTTSDGGRKRRYPIISTNLFDRQKSIFSIGLTHKDKTLFDGK